METNTQITFVLQGAARLNEAPILTRLAFKDIHLFMQEKGRAGNGAGYSSHRC